MLAALAVTAGAETWRGLEVAPEHRCAPYRSGDYAYPQSVEPRIAAAIGRMLSPYTGRCFNTLGESDIEHIVARSEAHDSGLCGADPATRRRFAADLDNLTLAGPAVNRTEKNDRDAADWVPPQNACWFAGRVIEVRRKYGLTIDRREAVALERILQGCPSTELALGECAAEPSIALVAAGQPGASALVRWDDDGNGRITCAEARRHRIAPVPRGHPAYAYMRDGDADGVVCE